MAVLHRHDAGDVDAAATLLSQQLAPFPAVGPFARHLVLPQGSSVWPTACARRASSFAALDVGQRALLDGLPSVAVRVLAPLVELPLSESAGHTLAVLSHVAAATVAAPFDLQAAMLDVHHAATACAVSPLLSRAVSRQHLRTGGWGAWAVFWDGVGRGRAGRGAQVIASTAGPRPFQQDYLDVLLVYLDLLRRANMQLDYADRYPGLPLAAMHVRQWSPRRSW